MPPNEREQVIAANKASEHLEQAKAELPAYEEQLERARVLLADSEYRDAKAIVVGLFEKVDTLPENLSTALMFIVIALGEDLEPLLKYMKRAQTAEERDADQAATDTP